MEEINSFYKNEIAFERMEDTFLDLIESLRKINISADSEKTIKISKIKDNFDKLIGGRDDWG